MRTATTPVEAECRGADDGALVRCNGFRARPGNTCGSLLFGMLGGRAMSWEQVFACGDGQMPGDRDWLVHCQRMAIDYLLFILGPPPEGCTLDIMWTEYEVGGYNIDAAPSVGVYQEFGDPPWDYISRAEQILQRFDEAVPWSKIAPDTVEDLVRQRADEPDENDDESDKETGIGDSSSIEIQSTQQERTNTRASIRAIERHSPVVAVDVVHLYDAVRLLQSVNTDPRSPIEIWSDEKGLNFAWGNAVARLPASDWLIGRFEAEPTAFFDRLRFPPKVLSRQISVWYSGRDEIVFDRYRVPGVRLAE